MPNLRSRVVRSSVLLMILASAACTALPPPFEAHSTKTYANDRYLPPQGKVGGRGEVGHAGRDFCRDVANRARLRAIEQAQMGWLVGGVAVGAAGAGSVLTATADSPSDVRKGIDLTLPIAGGILALAAAAILSREKDADALAAATTKATTLQDDDAAAEACNKSLADWESARSNADEDLVSHMKAQEDEINRLNKQLEAGAD